MIVDVVATLGEVCDDASSFATLLLPSWVVRFDGEKSSLRAGLSGPHSTAEKYEGVAPLEAKNGLFVVFSGVKMPSSSRSRRFVGLKRFGAPGDRGRLLGRSFEEIGKNCSRGSS